MFQKDLTNTLMRVIANAIKRVDTPKPLGRWYYINKNTSKDKKVDWTNEDHCGCCGTYQVRKSIMVVVEERTYEGIRKK
jgi:hypothetical protein